MFMFYTVQGTHFWHLHFGNKSEVVLHEPQITGILTGISFPVEQEKHTIISEYVFKTMSATFAGFGVHRETLKAKNNPWEIFNLCLLEVYQIVRAHVLFYQNSFCGLIGMHNNE